MKYVARRISRHRSLSSTWRCGVGKCSSRRDNHILPLSGGIVGIVLGRLWFKWGSTCFGWLVGRLILPLRPSCLLRLNRWYFISSSWFRGARLLVVFGFCCGFCQTDFLIVQGHKIFKVFIGKPWLIFQFANFDGNTHGFRCDVANEAREVQFLLFENALCCRPQLRSHGPCIGNRKGSAEFRRRIGGK